jgi:hypothetical protein
MTIPELTQMLERAAHIIERQQKELDGKTYEVKLPSSETIMIKGDQGEKGEQGEQGAKGDQGEPGKDGRDGIDGKTGPIGAMGKSGLDGKDGKDGKQGKNGRDGNDGLNGKNGLRGKAGKDGVEIAADDIASKLESLKGNDRLDASAIKNLNKAIGTRSGVQGGGFSMQAISDFIVSQGYTPTSKFVYNEVVAGSGTSFQLGGSLVAGTQTIYAIGQKLKPGSGKDYTITSGGAITTTLTWSAGDIEADYIKQ